MTNPELISRFLAYLRAERGASENTVVSYELDITKFSEWLGKPLPEVQRIDIQNYLSDVLNGGKSGQTAARHLWAIRSLIRFMIDDDLVEENASRNVPMPKKWKKIPKIVSTADIDKMVESLGTSYYGIRDRAILLTLFATGLRESELTALKLPDVNLETGAVNVWQGKGRKDGIVLLSPRAIVALREYLEKVRPVFDRDHIPIFFLGHHGRQLTRQRLYYLIRDIGLEALGKPVGVHQIRHSFGTALVEGGADIAAVQALMRHASIDTTQIYVHMDLKFLRRTYAAHPRAVTPASIQDSRVSQLLRGAELQPQHHPRLPRRSKDVQRHRGAKRHGQTARPASAEAVHQQTA